MSHVPLWKTMSATHEFLDHTSELKLRLRGDTFEALLGEAGRALGGLLLAEAGRSRSAAPRKFEVEGHDRATLLVDWLNEIIYAAEVDRWVLTGLETLCVRGTVLRAHAVGVSVPVSPARIKAATLHDLDVKAVPGGILAEVVLDV